MADDQDGIGSLLKNRSIAFVLFTATTASILVTIYHLVSICFCNRQGVISRRDSLQQRRRRLSSSQQIITPGSADRILAAELIPSHKYWKGEGVAGGGEDGAVCAVCLGEFEEGEELRAMPGCDHAFHAPCIDMWLFSHVTCPICRADATPSPRVCLTPETRLDLAEGLEDVVVNIDQSRRSLA